MEGFQSPLLDSSLLGAASSGRNDGVEGCESGPSRGFPSVKKRGHGSRSWIRINKDGTSNTLELDKATLMKHCSLPARDLRLLDPMFIYPSKILGREKAIVISLKQIRCIINADEVLVMKSLDGCVVQYQSELIKRSQTIKDQAGVALCLARHANFCYYNIAIFGIDVVIKVKELEMEIHPVLDELASSISTLNLERVRRVKGHLLALTQRVQKVRDEIEQLMDDDGDMAEMYLTDKKQRMEAHTPTESYSNGRTLDEGQSFSRSAPVSPVGSVSGSGTQRLQRAFSSIVGSSKHGGLSYSSNADENIEQLEMLLEAYFVVIDNTLSKILSEYFVIADCFFPFPHLEAKVGVRKIIIPSSYCFANLISAFQTSDLPWHCNQLF